MQRLIEYIILLTCSVAMGQVAFKFEASAYLVLISFTLLPQVVLFLAIFFTQSVILCFVAVVNHYTRTFNCKEAGYPFKYLLWNIAVICMLLWTSVSKCIITVIILSNKHPLQNSLVSYNSTGDGFLCCRPELLSCCGEALFWFGWQEVHG